MRESYRELTAIVPERKSENLLHVGWMLHDQCNHACSYCHPANFGGSYKWLTYEWASRFVDKVREHYKDKRILISFTGGEPTIWPDFLRLCEYLHSHGIEIGITTNGSRRPEFFNRLAPLLEFASVSYHPEFTRINTFIESLRNLSKFSCVTLRVMIPSQEEGWSRATQFVKKIREDKDGLNIYVELVRVLENYGTVRPTPSIYKEWQEKYLNENSFFIIGHPKEQQFLHADAVYAKGDRVRLNPTEIVNKGLANFKGWECYIGLEHIFINHTGTILRAGCKEGVEIGHISEDTIKFPKKPLICTKAFCHCTTDVMVRKYKEKRVLRSTIFHFAHRKLMEKLSIRL